VKSWHGNGVGKRDEGVSCERIQFRCCMIERIQRLFGINGSLCTIFSATKKVLHYTAIL
jgi:hypothetical protein